MMRLFSIPFALAIISTSLIAFAINKPLHVIIDPGHGGKDNGATRGSLRECDVTLAVSLFLAQILKKDQDFQATLTRVDNSTLSLEKRTEKATQAKGDIFVSIHVNASPDKNVQGMELFFQNQLPPSEEALYIANVENQNQTSTEESDDKNNTENDESQIHNNDIRSIIDDLHRQHRMKRSFDLAKEILNNWKGNNSNSSRSIRQGPFFVISQLNMPSLLVELGYITNISEAEKLQTPIYQQKLAYSLYQGLTKFKEVVDKDREEALNYQHAQKQ